LKLSLRQWIETFPNLWILLHSSNNP
jgi:hypothetical protein